MCLCCYFFSLKCFLAKKKKLNLNLNILVITGGDKQQHPYCRPEFLYLTEDEISLSADQTIRPVMCPKYPTQMPVYAGYAEVINTGLFKDLYFF